ncbi:MAG: hypothetical protein M1840_008754 [Geoglossum simile]|nr:MAG: hypothetical protein M1840_008754 [Geoglossum simile]
MVEGMDSTQLQPQPTMGPLTSPSLDPFVRIPPEVCTIFLSLLPAEDLITASHVSSFLRSQCLNDSLYAPLVKPRLNGLLQNTKSYSRDIFSYTLAEVKELVGKLSHISATSYFDNIDSIREFFLRQHFLMRSWCTGMPQLVQKLRIQKGYLASDSARAPIDRLVVDPVFNQVISMDYVSRVVFWDLETGTMAKTIRLERTSISNGLMDLKGNLLLIGTWGTTTIHICTRDPPSVPKGHRGFSITASLRSSYPIRSVILEGSVCIIGFIHGEVEFWELQKKEQQQPQCGTIRATVMARKILAIPHPGPFYMAEPNKSFQTLHYRRPYLLQSDRGLTVFSPRDRGANNLLDIWNYSAEDITWEDFTHVAINDDLPCLDMPHDVMVTLVRGSSDILITFPGSGVCNGVIRIDGFWNASGPTAKGTLLTKNLEEAQPYSLVATDDLFLTHSHVRAGWHKQPTHETVARLYHLNGDLIAEYVGYSKSDYLVMDPCFFVSVGADRYTCIDVVYFRPKYGRGSKQKEVNPLNPENRRQRTPKPNLESEDANRKPVTLRRGVKRNTNAALKKVTKTPKRPPPGRASALEDSSTRSEVMPWGDAAIQALISHSSNRRGLSVSDILGLTLCLGLREIAAGEEEDVLKEVGDALLGASQSGGTHVERMAASDGTEPKYRISRKRGGRRG